MDDFSDDGFDDLNDVALQELENNAVQFTQAQRLDPSQSASHTLSQFGFEDDDLDDAVVVDESGLQLPGPAPAKPLPPTIAGQPRWGQPGPGQQQPQPLSSSSVSLRPQQPAPSRPVPQPLPPPRVHPSQRHPSRPLPIPAPAFSQAHRTLPLPPTQSPSQFQRPPPPAARHQAPRPTPQPVQRTASNPTDHNSIIAALQAQLSTLQSELTSTKGETAILRSKYSKSQIDHQAEIERLRKQNAEQLAKQDRAVEAAIVAERQATTELQFARQDLKEELGRVKHKRKDGGAATPKKSSKTWGAADGFDDVEILPSPSKGHGQKRKDPGPVAVPLAERTPTKGKRKRPAVSSPAMELEVHADDVIMSDDPAFHSSRAAPAPLAPATTIPQQKRLPFDFLKLALDHSSLHGQPLTFDLFSRYAFPSAPTQSFASIIFEKLPTLGNSPNPVHLLIDFCEMLLAMWGQCVKEKYHQPIFDLAALLSYTLQLNTLSVAPDIIPTLLPLVQTTCFLVAVPRFNSPNGDLAAHPDASVRQLDLEIDVTQSLALLYLAALACPSPISAPDAAPNDRGLRASYQSEFWERMQLDFVFLMLSPKQPEEDFLGMLSLLCTSILPDSIGPINNPELSLDFHCAGKPEDETAEFVALSLIDRISFYLVDPPKWAPRGSIKQCRVRLTVLRTLTAFAMSPFGALQLAASPVAIPRLVTVLSWAVDSLYDMDVPQEIWSWKSEDAVKPAAGDAEDVTMDSKPDPDATQEAVEASSMGTKTDSGAGAKHDINSSWLAGVPAGVGGPDDDGDDEGGDSDKTELLFQLIPQLTLLLHTLVTDARTTNAANVPAKLVAFHGGYHRYLLTLSRLTFAEEGLIYEAGISADTVELAHELLELAVTPDEGEEVSEVFGP